MNMNKHYPSATPKRNSKRYSLTREDCQLDLSNSPLSANGIKVHPVPCIVGGKKKYRLVLEDSSDNICSLGSLAEELLIAGLNLHVSAVENILNTILDVIPKYIARTGRSVRIGNLITLKPYATGTIDFANDALDPEKNQLEIRATVSPALRHSLKKARLVNVSHRARGIDFVIRKANGARRGEVDTEHDLYINGTGIYVPPQSATEESTRGKVWIETLDGRMLGRCAVRASGPDCTTARFTPQAPVGVGEGRLFVETCGTKEAAEANDNTLLQRYSCDVRFV